MLPQKKSSIVLSLLLSICLQPMALADAPNNPQAVKIAANNSGKDLKEKDPEKFLLLYYKTIKNAKKIEDLMPFYRKEQLAEMDKMRKSAGAQKSVDIDKMMLEMMKSEQPKSIKILSKKIEKERAEFKLEPKNLPADKQALKEKGNFTMTGESILVKEDGSWKVYKDYWKSKTKDKNGSFSSSFGINPDRKKERMAANASTPSRPKDYSSRFRDRFFKAWKNPAGSGNVYAALLLDIDGSIKESHFVSKKENQEEAIKAIKELVLNTKSLPILPQNFRKKPYAWMQFSWSGKTKGRAISGPYFSASFPDWIQEKVNKSM